MIDTTLKDRVIQDDIWEGDEDTFNGVTSSRVDMQDQYLFDDMDDWSEIGNIGTMLGNEIKNIPNRIGVVTGAKNLINGLLPDNKNWLSHDPKNTEEKGFTMLSELKDKKYKNVKLKSKIGLYNSLENLLGIAAGFMVGSMGKSVPLRVLDEMAYKFAGGLGVLGTVDNNITILDTMPSAKEIIELNLANFYTMYTSKPGRYVKDSEQTFNYITYEDYRPMPDLQKKIKARRNPAYVLLDNLIDKVSGGNLDLQKILGTKEYRNYDSSLIISDKRTNYVNYVNGGELNFRYLSPLGPERVDSIDYQTSDRRRSSLDPLNDTIHASERHDKFKGTRTTAADMDHPEIRVETTDVNLSSAYSMEYTGTVKGVDIDAVAIRFDPSDIENDEVFDLSNTENGRRSKIAKLFTRVNQTFRRIGCLYVEPYYSENKLECFDIPFEFNPTITEGSQTAKYDSAEIMGRLLQVRSYISSDSDSVNIETTYIATNKYKKKDSQSKYWDEAGQKANWESSNGVTDKWLGDGWMADWTIEKLREIEMKYRSLTYPYIKNGVFVRPPIVRIIMNAGNYGEERFGGKETLQKGLEYVGDLFAYPAGTGEDKLDVTRILDGNDGIRLKRYIVTSVKIDPLNENWGSNYAVFAGSANADGVDVNGGYFRNGFKVSLSLTETTKNFLDIVPNYNEYYNAWKNLSGDEKNKKSHLSMDFKEPDEGIYEPMPQTYDEVAKAEDDEYKSDF